MFRSGLWTIGHWRGVPIRLHWSLPLGALFFGHFEFVPGFWLGFVLLILCHELGHAMLGRARGLYVQQVQVHGLGGVCVYQSGSAYDNAIVAWGGVLAQLAILIPAMAVTRLVPIESVMLRQLLWAFTETNILLIGLNLIPIEPLDGGKAWKLPKMWWQRRKRRRPTEKSAPTAEDATKMAQELAKKALDDAKN